MKIKSREAQASPKSIYQLFTQILILGLPTVLAAFLNFVIEIINLQFVGRFGDAAIIAGVGFANTYINLMFLAIN